ncbi:uncharacterized protein C16orf78 homolog [Pteropus alecto]|uniref:uncharacterized protein C16orf78 homolog n=1 Tax=Pteropus alecto TaxID=9402 RepID=UPI0003F17F22|nr:uncharacterized protein C16orf78 homolog [Pteropus alecto]
MAEKSEDPKGSMPTERKSMWKTAEERRMSDLTRVFEWLERRQGKKKQAQPKNKAKPVTSPKASRREDKKGKNIQKQKRDRHQLSFPEQAHRLSSRKDGDAVMYRRLYGLETKGKRLSMVPGSYAKDGTKKTDIEIKDGTGLESTQRSIQYRQSMVDPILQDTLFPARKSTLLREWVGKIPDGSYDRRLKNLVEKGAEAKMEVVRMLKPEEVLSCRYLRLSENNVRTLLKLCKDAGQNVDIHPHMVEGEIDSKKVFARNPTVAL